MASRKVGARVRVLARGTLPYGKETGTGLVVDISAPEALNGRAPKLALAEVQKVLMQEVARRGPIDILFVNSTGLSPDTLRELRENLLAKGTGPISSMGMWTEGEDGSREYSGWWVREDGAKKFAATRQVFTEEA